MIGNVQMMIAWDDCMGVRTFLKSTGLAIAAALVAFAIFPGSDLLFLAKALAFALALAIVFNVAYPYVRGVRKGDKVSVVEGAQGAQLLFFPFMSRSGFALTDGRQNGEIRIRLEDGKEAVGVVESYESIFSPPKVRLLYEERIVG